MSLKVRVDVSALRDSVARRLRERPELCRRAMREAMQYVTGEAKDLAPFWRGFLTADITFEANADQRGAVGVVFVPANAPSAQYAVEMHEGNYNLGKNSIAKQHRIGKPVGRRYISRAIEGNRQRIMKIIERRLKSQ